MFAMLAISCGMEWASADDGETFNLVISQYFQSDDNLYRLPSGVTAPDGKRSDTIGVTSLTGEFHRRYGRQRLRGDLGVTHAVYAAHGDLDYTVPRVRLAWDWQLGNRWSGVFRRDYVETSAGFENTIGTDQLIRERNLTAASADYWWHPDWAAGLGASSVRNTYRDDARPSSDSDVDDIDLNLTYRPSSGNRVVFTVRDADGRYPGRPALSGSIRDYEQQDVRTRGEWTLTGAMRVAGDIGYTWRSYDLAPNRDFDGITGRMLVHWQPTYKTALELSWRREIGAEEDVVANYAVTSALVFAPSWRVSEKLSLSARLERSTRDYGGDPELGVSADEALSRDDRTRRYGLMLDYSPVRAVRLGLGAEHQQRRSDLRLREYDATTVWVSGRISF